MAAQKILKNPLAFISVHMGKNKPKPFMFGKGVYRAAQNMAPDCRGWMTPYPPGKSAPSV